MIGTTHGCVTFDWYRQLVQLVTESKISLAPSTMDTRRLTNDTALAKGRLLWSEVQAELGEFDEVMQNVLAAEVATQRVKVDYG